MNVSAFLTSLPLPFEEAVRAAANLGFSYCDVVALEQRPASHVEALADSGLIVGCAALGRGLPEGQTLDALDVTARRAAVDCVRRQIDDAARLGAAYAYVVPGHDASRDALSCFAEALGLLADHAARRMVRLCVEHVPRRALPTVGSTVAFLEDLEHANLGLLLDIGHCLISEEEPSQAVLHAGAWLQMVHLDDNDSVGDLHWPLLTGRLTSDVLEAFLATLKLCSYTGGVTLELSPQNDDPAGALRRGREIVEALGRITVER